MQPPAFSPSMSPVSIRSSRPDRSHDQILTIIWAYFWLLIFEGALRKWVLPSLSNPLLLVRDPVVLLLYAWAITEGVFPKSPFILVTFILGLVSVGVSLGVDSSRPLVTLYGLRSNFLHLTEFDRVFELPHSDTALRGRLAAFRSPQTPKGA